MPLYRVEYHILQHRCCGRTRRNKFSQDVEASSAEEAQQKILVEVPKARFDSTYEITHG
jgi:hypothetical protein